MLEKRKYFSSTQEEFLLSQVKQNAYLYIYKHNYPEIIVRFPNPRKSIVGYDLTKAEITYHPFYENIDQQFSLISEPIIGQFKNSIQKAQQLQKPQKIQKIDFPYKGEIIINQQSDIFNEFFKRQVQSLLQESRTPLKSNNRHRKEVKAAIRISQIFEILLRQWMNDPFINTIFLVTQKHQKSFTAFDHGFIKLEVCKTSQSNVKIPFYVSPETRKAVTTYQDNKTYYFQFQSSVLFKENQDFSIVQKLGFVMPRPLSTNEFFFECLIMMFHEFQEAQERKQDIKKREQERIRIKETLLQDFRQMGIMPKTSDINKMELYPQHQNKQDPLDLKLKELMKKKEKPLQNEATLRNQMKINQSIISYVSLSQTKRRRSTYFEYSPQRRDDQLEQNIEQRQSKPKDSPRREYLLRNIKVIRSFTSQILEDDFEENTKRRFVTRAQHDKILKFNERIKVKKQQKQLEAALIRQQNEGISSPLRMNTQQEVVYVGPKGNHNRLASRNSDKKSHSRALIDEPFVFDYFSMHQETIVLLKKQEVENDAPKEEKWQNHRFPLHMPHNNREIDQIEIPGFGQISVIEKKGGRDRHSKTKALEFVYGSQRVNYSQVSQDQ